MVASETKQYTGDVIRSRFAEGSKSERNAVVLSTRYGEFVLRLVGVRPLSDLELDALVGKRIRVRGQRYRHVLVVEEWVEVG
jgi:hypothetical protein